MKSITRDIFLVLFTVSFLGFIAMIVYDFGLEFARRLGLTRSKGPFTRFVDWTIRPLLGERRDYGEWRGRKWREANPEK
jgi:hypothetical protein